MVSAHDVVNYILKEKGEMTAMKLQKLVYYSQAWSLVWDEQPLFDEKIEAWINGPVIRELYDYHKGEFLIKEWNLGDSSKLLSFQKETIDEVLNFYGDKSSHWLSDLIHKEKPWIEARKGLNNIERGSAIITYASMAEYYESLQ